MSLVVNFAPTSLTAEQYDEADRRLRESGEWPPEGMEYHVCFGTDGNLRVSEIWDSREQLDAFGERLMPVLSDIGIDPGQPEVLDVHNIERRVNELPPGSGTPKEGAGPRRDPGRRPASRAVGVGDVAGERRSIREAHRGVQSL